MAERIWDYQEDDLYGTTPDFLGGDIVMVDDPVRLRQTPGHLNKEASDILCIIPHGAFMWLWEGPQRVDGLDWWYGGYIGMEGFVAARGPLGEALIPDAEELSDEFTG